MPVRSVDVVPYAPSGPSLENPSPEWLDGGRCSALPAATRANRGPSRADGGRIWPGP